MTYLEAGNTSFAAGKANLRAGNFNKAAQDFDHALQMYQHHEWNAVRSLTSPAINISRNFLRTAIIKRDAAA